MNRTIRKLVRRGLLRAPGRFIAVFLITVLGAGFLAGLQSAGPGMAGTADNYFSQKSLADFWLYCDQGISTEDIEAVEALPEVASVSGGYGVDLVASVNGTTSFFAVRSLPQDATAANANYLSQLDLVAGRLPASATEAVADPLSPLRVGDTVNVSDGNREASLELLPQKALTIVGLAWSPRYISTERGSTKVGSGQVSQYLFVSESAFSSDWYTELAVRLTTTERQSAFSTGYSQAVKDAAKELRALTRERAEQRFEETSNDATAELEKGEAELKEKRAEVTSELEAGKKEIDDGRESLREAQEEYTKQEKKLSDSRADLEQAKADLATKKQELSEQRTKLEEGRKALEDGKAALAEAQTLRDGLKAALAVEVDPTAQAALAAQIAAADEQIDAAQGQVSTGEADAAAGQQALDDAESAIAAAEKDIAKADKDLAQGTSDLADAVKEINSSRETLIDGTADYNEQVTKANQEFADARADLDEGRRDFQALEKPTWTVQDRDDLPGYTGFSADRDRISSLSVILPWFFFLVAAIVCLTTMTRLVEEHRSQIGTLKANGYRRWQIMTIYQLYAWAIGLAGGAVGVVLGLMVFPSAIWNSYSSQYHMGDFETVITLAPCAFGLVGGAVALSLATGIAGRKSLNKNAAELMRPRSPRLGKRVFIERVTFLWRHLSFSRKATIRNLLRYKVRFIVTVVGVAGCTALLVAGFGLRDSIAGIVDLQYGEVSRAQATLVLEDPSSASDDTELNRKLLENEVLFSYAYSKDVIVTHDERTNANITTYLSAPEDRESFVKLTNFRKRSDQTPIAFPPDQSKGPAAIITEQVATALGVDVGEMISFGSNTGQMTQVRVGAVMENYVVNYIYLMPAAYESLLSKPPAYNTVVLRSDLQGDEFEALLSDLVSADNVATALPVSNLKTIMDQVIANLSSVIWLMIFAALALAIIVIYNLITINITERERELATLKVLGYHRREVAGYITREAFAMAFAGILIGLVLGVVLHAYVMGVLVNNDIMFPRVVAPVSLALAAIIPLLCTVLVNLCIRPRLNRLNPAISLKSIE